MLGEQIRKYRLQKNMSQGELGKMLGVIKQAVSSWEVGRNEPSHDKVERIADIFGVSTDELYRRKLNSLEENWPEVCLVLRSAGTIPTPEERARIARIIRATLDTEGDTFNRKK